MNWETIRAGVGIPLPMKSSLHAILHQKLSTLVEYLLLKIIASVVWFRRSPYVSVCSRPCTKRNINRQSYHCIKQILLSYHAKIEASHFVEVTDHEFRPPRRHGRSWQ